MRHRPGPAGIFLTVTSIITLTVFLGIPIAAVVVESLGEGPGGSWAALSAPQARSAIALTLKVALIATPLNIIAGMIVAWAVTRHRFWGRGVLVALVELPFTVSSVVAGMLFVMLYGARGWLGPLAGELGVKIIYDVPGMVLVTAFVTLPFVARALGPVMQARGVDQELAALSLGASSWQVVWRVTLPTIGRALLSAASLTFARAVGEFGAVAVVSGQIRGRTDTMSLYIDAVYNEYNFVAAFTLAALISTVGALGVLLDALARRSTLEHRP